MRRRGKGARAVKHHRSQEKKRKSPCQARSRSRRALSEKGKEKDRERKRGEGKRAPARSHSRERFPVLRERKEREEEMSPHSITLSPRVLVVEDRAKEGGEKEKNCAPSQDRREIKKRGGKRGGGKRGRSGRPVDKRAPRSGPCAILCRREKKGKEKKREEEERESPASGWLPACGCPPRQRRPAGRKEKKKGKEGEEKGREIQNSHGGGCNAQSGFPRRFDRLVAFGGKEREGGGRMKNLPAIIVRFVECFATERGRRKKGGGGTARRPLATRSHI